MLSGGSDGSVFDDLNNFLDDAGQAQDDERGVTVIRLSTKNIDSNVRKLYEKLEELGVNLDELGGILEETNNMLVDSSAGSGKTTALVLRIIKDLITGDAMKIVNVNSVYGETAVMVPANILVCTFLKTGASEIAKSFWEWCHKLGIVGIDPSNIRFSTIHKEVKDTLEAMGVKVNIIEDTMSITRSVMNKYGIRANSVTSRSLTVEEVSDMQGIVSYARNRLDDKRYDHPLMGEYRLNQILLDAVLNDLKVMRQAAGVMDFEDMQEMLIEAALVNSNVRDVISNRYDFIYVDEFQDTSQLQYELLKYYFHKSRRVIVIGDSDQCLVEGTLVETFDGVKPIEEVVPHDFVKTGKGTPSTGFYHVDHVSKKKVNEEIVVIKTKSGKELRGTKDHIGFARVVPNKETYVVGLTHRKDVGFSLEVFHGVPIHLKHERVDKMWVLSTTDCVRTAIRSQLEYSKQWGIPKVEDEYMHLKSLGKGYCPDTLKSYHRDLGTLEKGFELLRNRGISYDYPNFSSQLGCSGSVRFSMFGGAECNSFGMPKSELSVSGLDEKEWGRVSKHLLSVVEPEIIEGVSDCTLNSRSFDMDRLLKSFNTIQKECESTGIRMDYKRGVEFSGGDFDFVPFGNFFVGMRVPIEENSFIVEDEVVSVEREWYEGYVYDISVPHTRNFLANGIAVHNCIYSWRGSDGGIITTQFEKDLPVVVKTLSTNYRCSKNILNMVIPSITLNSNRRDKVLKANREGGQIELVLNGDVNHLVTNIKEDLNKDYSVAVLARTNADLLIPAMLLELDGGVDFGVSKAVSMSSRMGRQVFGVIDLITNRFTKEFEMFFKMFLPKYYWYEADKLVSVLKMNSSLNIYNIQKDDLLHSVPNLAPILMGLRDARKVGGVEAYIYLLGVMERQVYASSSLYNKKARDLVQFVRKIILDHKDVKDLEIGQINTLFNSVLPERIRRRIKYASNVSIKLSTVHEAKGKEWDSVYVWNNIDGAFPNQVGTRDLTDEEFEEERRVHYIAVTRAKHKLTHYSDKTRMGTFLKECDMSLVGLDTDESAPSTDTQKLFKRKTENVEVDEPQLDSILRQYISDVAENCLFTDERLCNIEIVRKAYEFIELVEKLESSYSNPFELEGRDVVLDLFFSTLADEIWSNAGGRN